MHPEAGSYRRSFSPVLLGALPLGGVVTLPAANPPDPATLRSFALDDLFVLRDYQPGKDSFVESPERHIGTWTNQGFRYTLAVLKGQGSLRHVWTTSGDGPPYFEWEFYVAGEAAPSVRGTDEELVEAAGRFKVPVAPGNSLPVHNRTASTTPQCPAHISSLKARARICHSPTSDWRRSDDKLRPLRCRGQSGTSANP